MTLTCSFPRWLGHVRGRSVILDSADCWAAGLVAEGVADMFIPIDFEDQDGLFERVLEAVRKAEAVLPQSCT